MPAPRPCIGTADIAEFVRAHCFRPSRAGCVGVELEALTVPAGRPSAHAPATVLADLPRRAGRLPAGGRTTIEPGGQVELSSAPHPGLRAALAATAADLAVLRGVLARSGLVIAPRAFDGRPLRRVLDLPRYRAMEAFFDVDGRAGRTMMCATASIQVNVDFGDEAGIAERWRLANALGPTLAAAFANSPADGYRSARLAVWQGIDRSRAAPVTAAGAADDPAGDWARYALDARVMLVRDGPDRYEPVLDPLTFREWMAGGHPLGYPTLADFEYHLTTLFPPVRPRGWLEVRMIDALPDPWWEVAVAVTTALLTDARAAEEARLATAGTETSWEPAARHALGDPALGAAARRCFAAARDALVRAGVPAATVWACDVFVDRFVARGRCPADEAEEAGVAVTGAVEERELSWT